MKLELIKRAARIMGQELKENRLEVVLLPAPDPAFPGHQVRAVQSTNPEWYRDLCAQYPKNRRRPRSRGPKYTDSLITRRETTLALARIAGGELNGTVYAERLLPYVLAAAEKLEVKL